MKVHVILLALALALSGCAFQAKPGSGKSASGSVLSGNGFSGTLSALVEPSIQSVISNAVSLDQGGPSFTLQVRGSNLGYRGVPEQPGLITQAPVRMRLGDDGCECQGPITTSSDPQTNQDLLSCTILKSACVGGVGHRDLTITRAAVSGNPTTVTSYNAVQLMTGVPFTLGAATVTCIDGTGQLGVSHYCKSSQPVQVVVTGTGLTGGQFRLGNNVCPAFSYQGTTGFKCTNFAAVCGGGSCSIQNLPLTYSQAGYSFTFDSISFYSPFTITGISPPSGIATQLNSIQLTGTNLSPNMAVTIGGKTCALSTNTSTTFNCDFTAPFSTDKTTWTDTRYHANVAGEMSFVNGGLSPTNAPTFTYDMVLNQLAVSQIRVKKGSGYQESRVLSGNQSGTVQTFEITGAGFNMADPTHPVTFTSAPNVVPICSIVSASTIDCRMDAGHMGEFSSVGAAVFGINILGNSSTRDLPVQNVFEVWGKGVSEVENLTTQFCSINGDCWVDESNHPFNFSDVRPRVWNRVITVVFMILGN